MVDQSDARRLAEELSDCRQRGLDWLDLRTSNQEPTPAVILQDLAKAYVARQHLSAAGRVAEIKVLLQDGIGEFERQGHVSEASLLRDLFFGSSADGTIAAAGVLLRNAREKSGENEARFSRRRASVMQSFSKFLIDFTASSFAEPNRSEQEDAPSAQALATYGYLDSNEHFIDLLARAVRVTIVGITNEQLPQILEEALRRKRDTHGIDAFWASLRIVFLGKALLGAVNDERERVQDSAEALGERRRDAVWARSSLWALLKGANSRNWWMYEYPHVPALNGALLELEHSSTVRLLIRAPRQPPERHIYIELENAAHHFQQVFEDIIHNCESADMIVPVGAPGDSIFHYERSRLQVNALKDGNNAGDWLPMVLVLTSYETAGSKHPYMQLRTSDNSARELGRLSHLTGHILQDDRLRPHGVMLDAPPLSFGLADKAPRSAAERIVQEVAGDNISSAIRPMATGAYLYPDKESLFFFVFSLDLPAGIRFPRRAEMHSVSLADLLSLRKIQILRSAAQLCRMSATNDLAEYPQVPAAEVLALNLTLHDETELGRSLKRLAGRSADELHSLAASIESLVAQSGRTSQVRPRLGRVAGLAGWQHREFFNVLLPQYAEMGISGAREMRDELKADTAKGAAMSTLAELYQDDETIASIPSKLEL